MGVEKRFFWCGDLNSALMTAAVVTGLQIFGSIAIGIYLQLNKSLSLISISTTLTVEKFQRTLKIAGGLSFFFAFMLFFALIFLSMGIHKKSSSFVGAWLAFQMIEILFMGFSSVGLLILGYYYIFVFVIIALAFLVYIWSAVLGFYQRLYQEKILGVKLSGLDPSILDESVYFN